MSESNVGAAAGSAHPEPPQAVGNANPAVQATGAAGHPPMPPATPVNFHQAPNHHLQQYGIPSPGPYGQAYGMHQPYVGMVPHMMPTPQSAPWPLALTYAPQVAAPTHHGPLPWHAVFGDATTQSSTHGRGKVVWKPSTDKCAVCFDEKQNLKMFEPCNHLPYCTDCVRNTASTHRGRIWCPHCNSSQTKVT